jgi:hypothetical protein
VNCELAGHSRRETLPSRDLGDETWRLAGPSCLFCLPFLNYGKNRIKILYKDRHEENKMNSIALSSELKRKLEDSEIMRINKIFLIVQRKVQKLWLIAFFRT